MPRVDLAAIPQVPLSFMNDDHRVEANLLNQLAQALEELARIGTGPAEVLARFDALLSHTAEHFERENQAMQRSNFPPYPVHRAEHDRVLEQMRLARDAFATSGALEPLRAYVVEAIPAWFISHIQSMDSVTAAFLSAHQA